MTIYSFEIFADYYQFYLQDETAEGTLEDSWTQEATDRMLAVADGTIGVGAARNTTVPVIVEVLETAPTDSLDAWDQVNECTLEVKSGRLVIAGCTDYFPNAARIPIAPGTYRARVYYGQLDSLSENGLEGNDYYRVVLWRGNPTVPMVLKRRNARIGETRG